MPSGVVGPLLLMLAAAAGSIDVLCVVRLGGAFASVITGNLIQVGRLGAALLLGSVAGGFVLRFAPLWTPVLPSHW